MRWRGLGLSVALAAAGIASLPAIAGASAPAATSSAASFEQEFIAETVDHHLMGVRMGQQCARRATDPELRDLCSGIVVNQSSEMHELREWLVDWYGYDVDPSLAAADKRDLRELRRERGERFDVAVSEMFVMHHRMQIRESKDCLDEAAHHDLRSMCRSQIALQRREIGEFRRLVLRG